MSFILDALRKSDQQRQRHATPTLMTAQTPAAQPKPFAWGWYAVLAVVLIGAGILIGWMHQWQAAPVEAAIQPDAGRPLESSAQKLIPAPLPVTPVVPEKPGKPERQPPPAAVAASPAIAGTPPESGVLSLSELPSALQQEIPKLTILVHSYSSKPQDRYVFINDRMWRENEYPLPGLKLEQITPEGVIFSYKGYRFSRSANP
ncbi:MAG: general secretion pathway protein GspB [Betaproteobacteria bacterium]|nr:general secretion pathway protein GspB [Betaproteobacteria bacterium]